jgi:hypothetical protein
MSHHCPRPCAGKLPIAATIVDLAADRDARLLRGERAGFAGLAATIVPGRAIRAARRVGARASISGRTTTRGAPALLSGAADSRARGFAGLGVAGAPALTIRVVRRWRRVGARAVTDREPDRDARVAVGARLLRLSARERLRRAP